MMNIRSIAADRSSGPTSNPTTAGTSKHHPTAPGTSKRPPPLPSNPSAPGQQGGPAPVRGGGANSSGTTQQHNMMDAEHHNVLGRGSADKEASQQHLSSGHSKSTAHNKYDKHHFEVDPFAEQDAARQQLLDSLLGGGGSGVEQNLISPWATTTSAAGSSSSAGNSTCAANATHYYEDRVRLNQFLEYLNMNASCEEEMFPLHPDFVPNGKLPFQYNQYRKGYSSVAQYMKEKAVKEQQQSAANFQPGGISEGGRKK